MNRGRGFTLLELLVALTLFAVVGGSLLQLFHSGLRTARLAGDQAHGVLRAEVAGGDVADHLLVVHEEHPAPAGQVAPSRLLEHGLDRLDHSGATAHLLRVRHPLTEALRQLVVAVLEGPGLAPAEAVEEAETESKPTAEPSAEDVFSAFKN